MHAYIHAHTHTDSSTPGNPGVTSSQGSERPTPVEAAAAAAADGFIDWHCWHRARRKAERGRGRFVRNIRGGYICMRGASRFFMVMGKRAASLLNDKGNESRIRDARSGEDDISRDTSILFVYSFSLYLKFLCVWTGFWKGCFSKNADCCFSQKHLILEFKFQRLRTGNNVPFGFFAFYQNITSEYEGEIVICIRMQVL